LLAGVCLLASDCLRKTAAGVGINPVTLHTIDEKQQLASGTKGPHPRS
jgi:hypothetical protein